MIRIFVGTPANNEDLESQAVLEYSLRKHASEEIDLTWMKLSKDKNSFWFSQYPNRGWLTRSWATPFSAFRWGVPAACGFEGRAIYLDIDMIVMDDIAKLWNAPMNDEAFVIAKNPGTFCCSLIDCARAKRVLPPIERIKHEYGLYAYLRKAFKPGQVQPFPQGENWNCLDGEKYASVLDSEVKILHCTAIPTQPQMKYALPRLAAKGQKHWSKFTPQKHPRADVIKLFDDMLDEAIKDGFTPEKYETTETFGDYHR